MKNKTATAPLSGKTKLALIITAIVVVVVIVLTIALVEILKPVTTPDTENPDNGGSSSLTIRNGDFVYVKSQDTAFPREAQNWNRYTAPSGNDTSLVAIENSQKALMGIIDTDDEKWAEVASNLADNGVSSVTNPKTHDSELDNNVYMIANKEATNASALSDSFSVSANTSVKITAWFNTSQMADGSKASVMILKSSTNIREENWLAYNFDIVKEQGSDDDNGWICKEFYLFNRNASSQSVRLSFALGNVYDKNMEESSKNAAGVLFVDDITFETVTANDYRLYADGERTDHSYKIIESTASDTNDKKGEYVELQGLGTTAIDKTISTYDDYLSEYVANAKVDGKEYAPFTKSNDFVEAEAGKTPFTIYQLSNNGTIKTPVGLQLKTPLTIQSSETDKDHHHISFWARIDQKNAVAKLNVLLQKDDGTGNYVTLDSTRDGADGKLFSNEVTSQTISTDTNNGWRKYDIYIKPTSQETKITLIIALGSADGHEAEKYVPNGTLYVTAPEYEVIAQKDYSNASSGTYSKKISLVGVTASLGVTNGTFSDTANTSTSKPASWTPVFAGQNTIYKDGKGDEAFFANLDTSADAVAGSGVVKDKALAPYTTVNGNKVYLDDSEYGMLKLVNNNATSQGYLSSTITLSSQSVYALSVLVKTEGTAKPYIYVINNSKDRDSAVVAKMESGAANLVDDSQFAQLANDKIEGGWVRYYVVIVTGKESMSVKLGLFNGTIDGQTTTGTVYYDQADSVKIGSYSLDESKEQSDKDAKLYAVNYTAESGMTAYDKLTLEGKDNVKVVAPTEDEWKEIRAIPEDDKKDDDNNNNNVDKKPVDLGLLFSVLSSVLLLAALLIVVVVRIYKNKNKKL